MIWSQDQVKCLKFDIVWHLLFQRDDGNLLQVLLYGKGDHEKLPKEAKQEHSEQDCTKFIHGRHSFLYRVLEMRSIDRNSMLTCTTS